ncbi:hypothetical protein FPSE_05109 [Fusarium pseudograminearum CS3096]|uniref:DNA/RNA-binding domain-containing protein n=1 Tax=Fusarium pseudograminearum (strain CS3096) TaxID=1028729 RepID=K3VK30_FUSPC|nr:hypothetical protein FPSE_05109 [Fusarium pseudograminearum CS3096]EKJ74774.1 hypothetical protein FPSE_05109 [Fusarium pseudograminearum CS3096]
MYRSLVSVRYLPRNNIFAIFVSPRRHKLQRSRMADFSSKWVRHLRIRDRQGRDKGGESQSYICDICGNESHTIEAWREHAQSDNEHRKDQVPSGAAVDEDRDADGHRDKRCSPPPARPTPSSPQASRSRARIETRIDFDRGPHKNTTGRQLWTEDNPQPKSHSQGRSVPLPSPRQGPPPKANRHTQPTAQQPPPPSFIDDDSSRMMRQPETRPISQDQLVAEVKGIYAGLVMVETKCIEVDNAQSSNTDANSKLNNEQWQALIALHRTLLHEHHDFFLASQHPSASPALRRLASKYAMPARMWRHGIHSFLELLRHRLPASLEHMLTFLYLAYSMMALLYETVPAFEDTWIECLGDLGRYRMAIEDDDIRDREVWTGLYFYTKSLCVPIPFSSARESIMTLFDPVLSNSPSRLAPVDAAFVRVHGILFSKKSWDQLDDSMASFDELLDDHIARTAKRWLESGYYIGISMACSLLGYGAEFNVLMRAMSKKPEETDVPMDGSTISEATPDETFSLALKFATNTISIVLSRWGDTNTLPFVHTMMVFMNYMTRYPAAISHLEEKYPWKLTSFMLNSLLASCEPGYEVKDEFQLWEKDQHPRPLPEDFAMRGLLYSEDYFPNGWFQSDKVDEDEKYFELPSMSEQRKDRIISLGHKLATSGSWLIWNEDTSKFSVPAKYDIHIPGFPM